MADNFWHNPGIEPKRNFRFELSIPGPRTAPTSNLTWLVKTCEKPKLNVSSIPHKYLNHTFNYPGRVVWNPIAITLVDPVSPIDTTETVNNFLFIAGYTPPHGNAETAHEAAATNIEKINAVEALGGFASVTIRQLGNRPPTHDSDAFDPIESAGYVDEWRLYNAFIQGDVNFGSLDYGNEELTTISLTLQYDWATFTPKSTPRG